MYPCHYPGQIGSYKDNALKNGLSEEDVREHEWEGVTGMFSMQYLNLHPLSERKDAMDEIRGKTFQEIIPLISERERLFPSPHHSIN